jgi:hypothetical protein
MAKTPQWQVANSPAGAGPVVSVPTMTDAPGRALAGLGQNAFETGLYLTQEAREADRRTKALTRQTAVDDYALDATQRFLRVRNEISSIPDPDQGQARWEQARSELLPATGDGVLAADNETLQLQRQTYDREMSSWEKVISSDLQSKRIGQAQASLDSARTAAVQMRDTSLFLERLQHAAPLVGWSDQQVQDEFSKVDLAVSHELQKDRIARTVSGLPYDQAVAYLNSDAPFYGTGMNPQEKQTFLHVQTGLLDRQRAAAAQAQNLTTTVRQNNALKLLEAAHTHQPVDLAGMWQLVGRGQLDPEAADRVEKVIVGGPVTTDDPAVARQLLTLQDRVARGDAAPAELTAFALAHAGTRLKETSWRDALKFATETYTPQMQALNDEVQQAGRELVTVTDTTLQSLAALANPALVTAAENQRANQYRQVDYVRRSLMDYVTANPQALPDDLYVQRVKLLRNLQRSTSDQVKSLLEAYESGRLAAGAADDLGRSLDRAVAANQRSAPAAPAAAPLTPAPRQGPGPAPAVPAPAGLEGVWDRLDADTRKDALTLLGRGWTAEMILEKLPQ